MVRTRRVAVVAAAAAMMITVAGCAEKDSGESTGTSSGPITIGAVLDITGAGASLGVPERKTLEMLTKQLNDAGGVNGREVKL
ncbi:MAG TPA: ABC transporter substrate-binding protein, partial [Jiangellales bacterium]|nr:ABC transporter substrate-binding protein [Jiangellales bacterium]